MEKLPEGVGRTVRWAALGGVRDLAEEAVRRLCLLEQQGRRRKELRGRRMEQETRSPEVRAAALRVYPERTPSGKP